MTTRAGSWGFSTWLLSHHVPIGERSGLRVDLTHVEGQSRADPRAQEDHMSVTQPRQPRGVPTGGQWRATARPKADVDLAESTSWPPGGWFPQWAPEIRIADHKMSRQSDLGVVVWTDYWRRPELAPLAGGAVRVIAEHAGRNAGLARTTILGADIPQVIVLRVGYTARSAAQISGPAVAWSYSDHHGMELVAVLHRGQPFSLRVPYAWGHAPDWRYTGEVSADGDLTVEELP